MSRAAMLEVVKANITKVIEAARDKPITEEVSMRDLGADSLEIIEVVSRSMKDLRIKVPRTELSTAKNLKDLLDLFEKASAERAAAS